MVYRLAFLNHFLLLFCSKIPNTIVQSCKISWQMTFNPAIGFNQLLSSINNFIVAENMEQPNLNFTSCTVQNEPWPYLSGMMVYKVHLDWPYLTTQEWIDGIKPIIKLCVIRCLKQQMPVLRYNQDGGLFLKSKNIVINIVLYLLHVIFTVNAKTH